MSSLSAATGAEKSLRVAVLASGAGTNLQALIDQVHGREGIQIVAVASDNPEAYALERAGQAGIPARTFQLGEFAGDRRERDRRMADWLREHGTQLVVMAGYMQLVSVEFLNRFPDAVINVHPSLLPAFAGIDAVAQSIAYGVKVFGVTVHFADEGLDTGAVIMQRSVELPDARAADDVWPHVHAIEHQILPEVVRLFARGAVRIASTHPRRVLIGPLAVLPER
jgi:phosphoribosylglycinamide formyltransferase-1